MFLITYFCYHKKRRDFLDIGLFKISLNNLINEILMIINTMIIYIYTNKVIYVHINIK